MPVTTRRSPARALSPSRYSKRLANRSHNQQNQQEIEQIEPTTAFADDEDKENYDIFPSKPYVNRPRNSIAVQRKLVAATPKNTPVPDFLLNAIKSKKQFTSTPNQTSNKKQVTKSVFASLKTQNNMKIINNANHLMSNPLVSNNPMNSVIPNSQGIMENLNMEIDSPIRLNRNLDVEKKSHQPKQAKNQVNTTLAMISETGNHVSLLSNDSDKSSNQSKTDKAMDESNIFNHSITETAPITSMPDVPPPKMIINKNLQLVKTNYARNLSHALSLQNLNQTLENYKIQEKIQNLPNFFNDTVSKACHVASDKILKPITRSWSWNFFKFPDLKGRKMIREIEGTDEGGSMVGSDIQSVSSNIDDRMKSALNVQKKHVTRRRRLNGTGEDFSSNESVDGVSINSTMSSTKAQNQKVTQEPTSEKTGPVIILFLILLVSGYYFTQNLIGKPNILIEDSQRTNQEVKESTQIIETKELDSTNLPTSTEIDDLNLKITNLSNIFDNFSSEMFKLSTKLTENYLKQQTEIQTFKTEFDNFTSKTKSKFNLLENNSKFYLEEIVKLGQKFDNFEFMAEKRSISDQNKINELESKLINIENTVFLANRQIEDLTENKVKVQEYEDEIVKMVEEKVSEWKESQIESLENSDQKPFNYQVSSEALVKQEPKCKSLINLLTHHTTSINHQRTSTTAKTNEVILTLFDIPLFTQYNSPGVILENHKNNLTPGNCWSSRLPVKISFNIKQHRELEIAGFSVTILKNSKNVARNMKIYGGKNVVDYSDRQELMQIDLREKRDDDNDYDIISSEHQKYQEYQKFESYFYDFDVNIENPLTVRYLEVEVLENFSRDDDVTCFYNFGVYGRII